MDRVPPSFMTSFKRGDVVLVDLPFPKPRWLAEESVVNLIGLVGVDNTKIERLLGPLPTDSLKAIDEGLVRLFGL